MKSQKWDEQLRKKRKIIDVEKSDTEKPIGVSMRPGCWITQNQLSKTGGLFPVRYVHNCLWYNSERLTGCEELHRNFKRLWKWVGLWGRETIGERLSSLSGAGDTARVWLLVVVVGAAQTRTCRFKLVACGQLTQVRIYGFGAMSRGLLGPPGFRGTGWRNNTLSTNKTKKGSAFQRRILKLNVNTTIAYCWILDTTHWPNVQQEGWGFVFHVIRHWF